MHSASEVAEVSGVEGGEVNNRRSFLKMMFGGLAAAVAAPVVAKRVDLGVGEVRGLNVTSRPFAFLQNFDFESEQSILMQLTPDADFFIYQIGLWLDPSSPVGELQRAVEGTYMEVLMAGRSYLECPLNLVNGAGGVFSGRAFRPIKMNGDLEINLLSSPDFEGVKGVSGRLIVDGIKCYSSSR